MKIPPRFKSCSVAYYNAAGIHLYKNANALVIYSTWVIAQCHSKLHKNQLKSNQNSLGIWIFAPKKLSHESDALSKTKSMPISILIFSVKIQVGVATFIWFWRENSNLYFSTLICLLLAFPWNPWKIYPIIHEISGKNHWQRSKQVVVYMTPVSLLKII